MQEQKDVSRREFTEKSVMAILSGVVITITGCGDSNSSPATPAQPSPTPPPAPPTGSADDVAGVVSANHGHIATITRAEIMSGNDLTLDIDGDAGHPHTVELTADELTQIGNGVQVSKAASTLVADDPVYPDVPTHGHTVTFN